MRLMEPIRALAVIATVIAATAGARADNACCRESGCISVQTQQQCDQAGGFFLPNQSCLQNACGVGACCSPLSCFSTDAFSCMAEGRDFAGAGISCLTDPCGGQTGACCHNNTCSPATLAACNSMNGSWLGGGTSCGTGMCSVGACCSPGSCQQIPGYQCLAQGGTFRTGANCSSGTACDQTLDCPLDSMYSQSPIDPNEFTAGVSEVSTGVARYDDYHSAGGLITGLVWWGIDVHFNGTTFVECTETNNTFQIRFVDNDAGTPGLPVCSYTVVATRTPTGRTFGSFQENEYRATFPTPCALPHGWVSIVGAGSTTCEFLWENTPEVDDRSYCDICDPQNQPFDLSFCIRGANGGSTGACCDWTAGTCADGVNISACADDGQHFVAGTLCQNLSPSCDIETGACCRPDGTCGDVTPGSCEADGGRWLGPGASCDLCPVLGGCCLAPGNCAMDTAQDCANLGRTYAGDGTTCNDCPPIPTCDPGSIFSQNPDGSDSFAAYQSEAGFTTRYENLPGIAGTIDSLTWWGADLEPIGPSAFRECAEAGPFDITFYEDAAGVPGEAVCTYTLTPQYTPTIHRYLGATLNQYVAELPTGCIVRHPWVSIIGKGSPSCQFYWVSSGEQDGIHFCDGCDTQFEGINLNICVGGTQGGVFGACCHGPSATCAPNTDIASCNADLDRFLPDGACNQFDPPCGVILGACCFAQTATCAVMTQASCTSQQGNWLGGNSICSQCPCAVACPPGGRQEGEVTCFPGYDDHYNSGCSNPPATFTSVNIGDTVCGNGGVYESGEDVLRDVDWYAVDVTRTTELTWTLEATFPIQGWIIDGRLGCPGTDVAANYGFECDEVNMSAVLDPGRYWLVAAAISQTDSSQCSTARYAGTVSVGPPNAGDADGDGDVDLADFAVFANCLFGPAVQPLPAPPATTQQCLLTFDFNVDGDVDLQDFAAFEHGFNQPVALRAARAAALSAPNGASPSNVRIERVNDAFRPGYRVIREPRLLESADSCAVGAAHD